MHYKLSYSNPNQHFIDITLEFEADSSTTELRLPSWRPGRYQIQNFAKNIKNVTAFDELGGVLPLTKTGKDSWLLKNTEGKITVCYSYYAFTMDAGNSWLDDEQLYVNFINCAMYIDGRKHEPCSVELEIPEDYKIATGLKRQSRQTFSCESYHILVDSPLMASASLRQMTYHVDGHTFNLWIQGELPKTAEEVTDDFIKFTRLQMKVMGGFPCEEYHFLFQCLPYKHYHGVEHWNSTVITMGPSEELKERKLYREFLGVSSHELFHTWNVIRLRPKEMMPYDFQTENYHETGFVTEGVTTYYGDLFLARCGVFNREEYLLELNKLLKRHYENEGRKHYSVAESSYDLWLDGYERGIPGRKVSIYNEGALAAMILDLKIRLKTNSDQSLDGVMQLMWERHGKNLKGYDYKDYQSAAEKVYGGSLTAYFADYISGTKAYETELEELLSSFGLSFELNTPTKPEESCFGLRVLKHGERYFIDQIAPGAPAEQALSVKDEILTVGGVTYEGNWPDKDSIDMEINRFGRKLSLVIKKGNQPFFPTYQVSYNDEASEEQKRNLNDWVFSDT